MRLRAGWRKYAKKGKSVPIRTINDAGKTVVVYQSVIIRLNQNRTLDTSWGVNGSVEIGEGQAIGYVARRSDGSWVVTSSGYIWCLDGNGQVNTSFGTDGKVDIPTWGRLFVLADDSIITDHVDVDDTSGHIQRITQTGEHDATFGGDGSIEFTRNAGVVATSNNGFFVLNRGQYLGSQVWSSQVSKFQFNGLPDATWGASGSTTLKRTWRGPWFGGSGLVDADGGLYLATQETWKRYQYTINSRLGVIQHFTPTGQYDTSFSDDGMMKQPGYSPYQILQDGNQYIAAGDAGQFPGGFVFRANGTVSSRFSLVTANLFDNPIWDVGWQRDFHGESSWLDDNGNLLMFATSNGASAGAHAAKVGMTGAPIVIRFSRRDQPKIRIRSVGGTCRANTQYVEPMPLAEALGMPPVCGFTAGTSVRLRGRVSTASVGYVYLRVFRDGDELVKNVKVRVSGGGRFKLTLPAGVVRPGAHRTFMVEPFTQPGHGLGGGYGDPLKFYIR